MFCPRESSFNELYASKHSKVKQDDIRAKNRNEAHCKWLRDEAGACDKLPSYLADIKDDPELAALAGQPCPNNPYIKYKGTIEEGIKTLPYIEHADKCLDELEWGLASPHMMGPKDFMWAKVSKRMRKYKDAELLSKMLAQEISKIFGEKKK